MLEPDKETMTITHQCSLLGISRSRVYYAPKPVSDYDWEIMSRIDEIYTDNPSFGTRRIKKILYREYKIHAGREKISTLMLKMGIHAVYPKKNLSRSCPEHKKYPYLLRNLQIIRSNQVWSTDITYIRLTGGYVYLTAIMDWYSRYILAWRLSTTLDHRFCVEALEEAIEKYGVPEYFNTDQGIQFTCEGFQAVLGKHQSIKISMDGRGRSLDNVFIERLWRSLKYEEIYMRNITSVGECRDILKKYFNKYNTWRPHQALNYLTPQEVYLSGMKVEAVA